MEIKQGELVHKFMANEQDPVVTPQHVLCCISTESPDRMGDIVSVAGWDTRAYEKNPVVLFAHDQSKPPIGRSKRLYAEGKGFYSECEFAPTPFAKEIEQLVRGGFIKTTSVGFRSLEHQFIKETGGIRFNKQELLEYSFVPVPANSEALVAAKAQGINTDIVYEWAEKMLELKHGRGSWISEKTLVATMKQARFKYKSIKKEEPINIALELQNAITKALS